MQGGRGGLYMFVLVCMVVFSYFQEFGCFVSSMFKVSKIYIVEILVLVRFVIFKYVILH